MSAAAVAGRDPAWLGRVVWAVAAIVLLWPMLVATEFRPWTLFGEASRGPTLRFLASFVPPRLDRDFLVLVARGTWRTVAIANAGIALALPIAIPTALLSTRVLSISALSGRMSPGAASLRQALRWGLVVLRSIPELVWALVFVRVVGLGPTAGVLAIALTYGGMLGKVYADIFESSDTGATRTLLGNGSGRLQAFAYGLLPSTAAELTSYSVYRWECAIRSSVVLGFVGAGGLGQELDNSTKMYAGGEVATMLLVFVALVALADRVSGWLRTARMEPDRSTAGVRAFAVLNGWTGGVRWTGAVLVLLLATSVWSLDLQWHAFLSPDSARAMSHFVGEFFPPDASAGFLRKVASASVETLAMSALGTLLAAAGGIVLAQPASRHLAGVDGWLGALTRLLLNALRAVPELVWATLLLISAGLGPFAGTLALALHTTGVLGRLYAEAIDNAPEGPSQALRVQGIGTVRVFLYATFPQVLPQLISYTLYRWENNIRAAAILGVVGAGGLGQLLSFHLGLFQMGKTATVVGAMVLTVAMVDALSYVVRRLLSA